MESINIEKEILLAIRLLSFEQQKRLLDLIRSFVPKLQPEPNILEFAGCVSAEDAVLMENAIENDCNKIDYDEW